jgi:hypothetical protein
MKWIAKALLQKGMELTPNPAAVNFFFQRHITKSFPAGEPYLSLHTGEAFNHFRTYSGCSRRTDIENLCFFEFGAGWDLAIPLTYAAMGARQQTVIDLTAHFRPSLMQAAINYFKANRSAIELKYNCCLSDHFFVAVTRIAPGEQLLRALGIEYRAPLDARRTGLASESFDLITNTSTLAHIPADDLLAIAQECSRILRPGGCMSCRIDLEDNYSHFDPGITPYNFLKFSETTWNTFFNSSVHYQNRLRANDYLRIFEKSGLEIVLFDKLPPSADDLKALRSLKLSKEYNDMEDVGVRFLKVLLQKQSSGAGSS